MRWRLVRRVLHSRRARESYMLRDHGSAGAHRQHRRIAEG